MSAFEQKLWEAADLLRGHMDAAGYKHAVQERYALVEEMAAHTQRHGVPFHCRSHTTDRRRRCAVWMPYSGDELPLIASR